MILFANEEIQAFRESSDSCLRALATEITERRVCHGDLVYHKGEPVDEVVFIMSGKEDLTYLIFTISLGCLEILEDDDVVVAILSNGDAFGEEVWKQLSNGRKFKKQKSRYYVRALAPTDLRLLKSESLSKVLQFYHQFGESFESKMRLRYT